MNLFVFFLMNWGACFSQSGNWVSQEPESILETILCENIFIIQLNDIFHGKQHEFFKNIWLSFSQAEKKVNIFTEEACYQFLERRPLLKISNFARCWLGIFLWTDKLSWFYLTFISFLIHPKICDNLKSYKIWQG